MQPSLVEILACPLCQGKLELKAEAEKGGEIVTGAVGCTRCGVTYPIKDGIPDMLPPENAR
jgi:uncharacterized protein YbaR (Trm112 family)